MAGFGAGFARALGTSLDAAGKSHLEEQRRDREYERAKADRQAELLQYRAWQKEDLIEKREYDAKIKAEDQEFEAEKDYDRYFKKDGKYWYTRIDGTVVERPENSPGVQGYLRRNIERSQRDSQHALKMEATRADIRQSNAAAAASDARARADSGRLPDDVYAQMQFDLKPVSATYDNIDKKVQGIIARAQHDNSNPNISKEQRKANEDLIAEAREMRRALLPSQKALSAQYVASGFKDDPYKLFEPRAEELRSKFPNAWGRFAAVNAQEVQDRRAANDARRRELQAGTIKK